MSIPASRREKKNKKEEEKGKKQKEGNEPCYCGRLVDVPGA